MKEIICILLLMAFFLTFNSSYGQNEKCNMVYDFPEKEASFKSGGADVLHLFNHKILESIYEDNSDNLPPTSFKMTIIINDNDEVESIYEIHGDYSDDLKEQILKTLKKETGWKSGEINGQKVCSKFHFIIGCILLN